MRIESDTPAIEKNLRFLEKTIVDYGGYLAPDLLIKCEDGNLSVSKQGAVDFQSHLIVLPGELLLPTEKMGLSVKNDEIFFSPEKGALTEIQYKLADSMIELYNLTDKIKNHKKECCWLSFCDNPEPLEKLLAARTLNQTQQDFMDFTVGNPKGRDPDEVLCKSYVKTRVIGHKKIDEDSDDVVMTSDIMPVVDFINHHHAGGFFGFNQKKMAKGLGQECLRLNDSRPLADSRECFAYYNQLDVLDSFINYGFPDSYAPYVRSVPVEFEIPGSGKIVANARQGAGNKERLNVNLSGLRPYIPNTLGNTKEVFVVSHLLIPTNRREPDALRRVLRLLISNRVSATRALTPDGVWQCVLDAEEMIINKNITFYETLLAELEGESSLEVRMVRMVAELQLTKLYKYSFDESHYISKRDQNTVNEAAAAE